MTKSSMTSVPCPGMLPSEARFWHFQSYALFTQVEFFENTVGPTTRLPHILNFPGASLTEGMFLMIVAE